MDIGACQIRERTCVLGAVRELHLSHTRIVLIEGEPIDHPREALYTAMNARGIMVAGFAGAIRLAAGAEVERELRAQGTLLLGEAYLTGPGNLSQRGVARIVHGITTAQPGVPPTRAAVESALVNGLELLAAKRTRSATLPEVGTRVSGIELADAADILSRVLAAHLRRGTPLDEVLIVGLHLQYLRRCRDALLARGAIAP